MSAPPLTERERIRKALIDLVVEHGFEATTVEMIAARAGISPTRFERHFADKHQCLDEAYELQANTFTVAVREAFSGSAPWRDRLRAATYRVLRVWSEDVIMTNFMMIGALVGGEIAQGRRDRMFTLGVDIVDAGRQELDDPDSMSRSRAEATVGAAYEPAVAGL